ncbi:unnamed protein product [Staurois parvus]|uniref:Uncharacterized protein n=1 Tax=Staurois parvus TaxID=386267 RepID=A0ABN9EBV5_9NEOB|nr:unnamed protein product [Staurois parvus]
MYAIYCSFKVCSRRV